MCWLVIMCALALIRTGTEGVVISGDKTPVVDSGDKRVIGDDCLSKCVSRCQRLMDTRHFHCCKCDSFCESASDTPSKNLLQRASDDTKTPCAKGNYGLSNVSWRRLLVPRGLHRSKRRPSRSPMLREAALIARSVGMDLGPLDTGFEKDESSSSYTVDESQVTLRLESLERGEASVSAHVSWSPAASSGSVLGTPWYLVAWEPEGGGVRGNLLTNSTSATLTLWPDTVYHIQVSSGISRVDSQCLEVDTHPSSTPLQVVHGLAQGFALSRVDALAAVTAALLLFLVIIFVSAKRWKNRPESPSKNIDNHQDVDRFKLYPPPVTLRHLAEETKTTHQLPV